MESKLVVRLGAMGDIIHTLPAVAALGNVSWMIKPRWQYLIEGNPAVREILTVRPARRFDIAYDFQGLIKSAFFARLGSSHVRGFSTPREGLAKIFYSEKIDRQGRHVVDHNLALAGASGPAEFWLPPGIPEGKLPDEPFILACPLAGWKSKQWPIERYRELAKMLPLPLVLNGPPGSGLDHESGIPGLIDATRRAAAVIGVDSGPLHIAAALKKPGVALYGPTCPGRNGPYGSSIQLIRDASARTNYKRQNEYDPSMLAITTERVAAALKEIL